MQHTLRQSITIDGIGLHSGAMIRLCLQPAPVNHGVVFFRTDVGILDGHIFARWDQVVDTQLCTVIGNEDGVRVGTIEHLMAALRGCGVDNVLITLNGPEVPVMDGSAMPFVTRIEEVGLQPQAAPRHFIRVLRDVNVTQDGKTASLKPSSGSDFAGVIEFPHPQIGRQRFETRLLNGNFKHDLAQARTFGFLHEVEWMQSRGLARGGSLANAIVLDHQMVMNPEGLRFADEFIRHKILDAVGDLYLAGAPILGAYEGEKPGHAMNNALLHALFSSSDNYEITGEDGATLPPVNGGVIGTGAARVMEGVYA